MRHAVGGTSTPKSNCVRGPSQTDQTGHIWVSVCAKPLDVRLENVWFLVNNSLAGQGYAFGSQLITNFAKQISPDELKILAHLGEPI